MKYVSSFIMPVPKKHIDDYRGMARKFGKIWIEHGALGYTESVADDIKPGKLTSFPQSVMLKPTETVVLSWVTFKTRAHHDRVVKKVMSDPRAQKLMNSKEIPIDGKRMFWGGFDVMVNL